MAPPPEEVRLDKWLWSVRIYKTRTLATKACQVGHVRVDGHRVKAARSVRLGETVTARVGELTRTIRVLSLLDRRVGARLAADYAEDLTPESERRKPREPRLEPLFHRVRGAGRPTKRDRRLLDKMGNRPEAK